MCCNWQRKEEKSFQFMKMQWENLISHCNIYSTGNLNGNKENKGCLEKDDGRPPVWRLFGKIIL
jgi:hypothetical protein